MATHPISFAAVAGALFLALAPNAIGLDDDSFREPAYAIAPIVLPLPPESPPLAASLYGVDPQPTSRLPPKTELDDEPPAALSAAVKAYLSGNLADGDREARRLEPGLARVSAEWAALRTLPREVGLERIERFLSEHPDWPAAAWLKKRSEEALYGDPHDPEMARAFFAARPPRGPAGKLALARLRLLDHDEAGAAALVADVWRHSDLNRELETSVKTEFGGLLTRADHKFRADRLLYKENVAGALRAAEAAGTDVALLAKARAAVIGEAASDAAIAAVPKPLQSDPGLLFAQIQKLRRAGQPEAAAALMLKAPGDRNALVEGDEWWVERRLLARAMLDAGEGEWAYTLCAQNPAVSPEARIEAEFHAGWIALRFLDDARRAEKHFRRILDIASAPASEARGYYWLGRALETQSRAVEAEAAYQSAAAHSATFYGQLAHMKLGGPATPLRLAAQAAAPVAPPLPVRVADALRQAGAKDIAAALLLNAAQIFGRPDELAGLAAAAERMHDARLSLNLGKASTQHGAPLDDLAFPTFGVPDFEPLPGSVDKAMVYAIVRQESAFSARAASGAGAKGLMQMLVGTARATASRQKVAFDAERLTTDPAFNAQLGAAHLGTLFQEHGGSAVLAFAAYNAGGGRVKEWIKAHGDPRDPNVDVVDWIELIPITETRNYVERVLENLQVYRARFGQGGEMRLATDLKPGPASAQGWRQATR